MLQITQAVTKAVAWQLVAWEKLSFPVSSILCQNVTDIMTSEQIETFPTFTLNEYFNKKKQSFTTVAQHY